MQTLFLDLTPLTHIGAISLRKVRWMPVFKKAESCIESILNIGQGFTIVYKWYL